VARRILAQLGKDPRFLFFSGLAPILLVVLLKYVFDAIPGMRQLGVRLDAYAVPAAGFFIFFITYLLCTIVLVRERRDGTLGRMFAAGYRRGAIVLGYVAGYSTIALVQTALVLLATVVVFDVSLGGNALPVAVTTMALSVVSLSLGLVVSTVARTEGQIFPTIPLIAVPSLLLSGLVIPHESLPGWLQGISYAIPLTYAERVLLGLVRDGKSFAELAGSLGLLGAYGAGALVIASLTLRDVE
jgi:ABC-2 type transport system permease protein